MNFTNLDVQGLKAAFNKVKAAVMNLTELEQKVKEATNCETWGASTTMMQEIANATFHHEGFNEVMPAIYKRFSQEGRTWRNIYKALVLIEYIVKNGSDRAVDYCKSHIYDVKACMNFQFTDERGKDQGLNIRHRSKIIADMLQDDNAIREQRQKAREFANKQLANTSTMDNRSYSSYSSTDYGGYGSNSGGVSGGIQSQKYRSDRSGFPGFTNQNNASTSTGLYTASSFTSQQTNNTSAIGATFSPSRQTKPPANDSEFAEFQGADTMAAKPPVQPPTTVNLLDFDDTPSPQKTVFQISSMSAFNNTVGPSSDEEWTDFTAAPTAATKNRLASNFAPHQVSVMQPTQETATSPFAFSFANKPIMQSNANANTNWDMKPASPVAVTATVAVQQPVKITPAALLMNPEVVNLQNLSQFCQPLSAKPVGPSMNSMILQAQSQQKAGAVTGQNPMNCGFGSFTSAPNQQQK